MDDRIARLALVDWPEGESVPQIQQLRPPALNDRAVLLVRRVSVVADPGDVPAAVTAEVQAGAARAVRPDRGGLALEAEALLFEDESEVIACYLVALSSHSLEHHWCWPLLRTTLPPPALSAVVGDPATPVLGVLAALVRWGRLTEVVGDLDRAARWRVLTALAERHDLWLREEGVAGSETALSRDRQGAGGLSLEQPFATVRPGPDLGGGPRGPEGGADLGDAAPARAMTPGPTAWGPGGDGVSGSSVPPGTWQMGREGSTRVLWQLPPGEEFPKGLGRLVETLLGRRFGAGDGKPPPGLRGARGLVGEARGSSSAAALQASGSAEPVVVREPDVAGMRTPSTATTRRERSGVEAPSPGEETERGTRTDLGGVLYLVNLLRRFDVLEFGLGDAGAWDLVDGLARAALRDAVIREEAIWDDPIWDVLAALAGREPDTAPDPDISQRCADVLATLTPSLAFTDDEPGWGTLLAVPGRVVVDATHVELFTTSTRVHLSIRRRALDSDPGWVPALGRVVLFHFTGPQP